MEDQSSKLALIAEVVSSFLRRNSLGPEQIATVVANVTKAMSAADQQLGGGTAFGNGLVGETGAAAPAEEKREPAVSVRASVKQDYIVCLDCGAKVKTLKRHLQSAHGLDPRAYRARWDLKKDYPMTAPAYSERRSAMARDLGLGRKAAAAPKRRGRKAAAPAPANE